MEYCGVRESWLKDYLVYCRRTLHKMPELHSDLPETTAFVVRQLEKMAIKYQIFENGGIVASLGTKTTGGKSFLLRADMDALPIEEISGESFSSRNGNMHACGHDMHVSMLLGAAKILKAMESGLQGQVVLVFQFDEEGISGMETLIKNGLFQSYDIGGALAIHVMPGEDLEVGSYTCLDGPANSSVDIFEICIEGKGAHGAMPYKGHDPIAAGVQVYTSLLHFMAKELDARETALLSIGYFLGGTTAAYNVIPHEAILGGGIRSLDNGIASFIRMRTEQVVSDIANIFHCQGKVTFSASVPACVNDALLTRFIHASAKKSGLNHVPRRPQLVSDDFAHVSILVPSCYVWLGAGSQENKFRYGSLHDPAVCFDERAMPYGVELLVQTTLKWLTD